ncbi:MAG TPA: aminotransferase class V-fold PLP-dependent enzyme [Pyrinomonadaceae bacterium]|nr:aminotransferase class V-fold PLP-dependent enzyme [Pyrinomonadaceae bacterium]
MSPFNQPSPGTLPSQRELFEIPEGVTYLNCANMSPQLRSVSAAGMDAVAVKKSPWELKPADWFSGAEALRALAAQVAGTTADSIAIVPAASYGIAVAAANVAVERGQSIVLLDEEFPSNYYAWKELSRRRGAEIRLVKRGVEGTWTQALLGAIDAATAVVSVPNCHWTDGSLVDLEAVGERARSVGAALVVDASQSLGAYPLDIERVRPDFLVCVGYKWLLCPYTISFLYAAPKWQREGRPIEYPWMTRAGSEDFSRLVDYKDDQYRPGARRFDMGESSNFVLGPMAAAALRQILEWGIANIRRTLSALTALISEEAERLGCRTIPAGGRVDHMTGIRLPKGLPAGLGERLAEEKVFVSIRGDAIRVSPHLYNGEEDVRKFFSALRKLI